MGRETVAEYGDVYTHPNQKKVNVVHPEPHWNDSIDELQAVSWVWIDSGLQIMTVFKLSIQL